MAENSENAFKVPVVAAKSSTQIENKTPSTVDSASEIANNAPLPAKQSSCAPCPYKEPKWSGKPNPSLIYKFEVLKAGAIVEEIDNLQEKSHWVFGRLPNCDIVMAHPTISRFHAILQYRPEPPPPRPPPDNDDNNEDEDDTTESLTIDPSKYGKSWYIYDLGSTHGTFLNKMRIPPKTYIQVKVGHMIRLGTSTRNFILQGPEFDQEPESELSITEMKELRLQQEKEKRKMQEMQEIQREREGIDWGLAEDADEETDLTVNPYASTNNEELFLDDPKKTLRGFFEREGLELEYKTDEMSAGTFVCRVELPVDDANGRPLVAEVCHKGKKKDCVLQCALEACRILDRHGVLRQAHHEPLKRKLPTADSDEDDDFLDRTGDIERKKLRKAAASRNSALTYEDLLQQEKEIIEKMSTVEESISKYHEISKRSKESTEAESDDLDAFMTNLAEDRNFDKTEIRKLRVEQLRLKGEYQKNQKLIKIAKPVELPSISSSINSAAQSKKNPLMPLFGKRNKLKVLIPRSETKTKPVEKEMKSDEEEVEEEEGNNETEVHEHKTKMEKSSTTESEEITRNIQSNKSTFKETENKEKGISESEHCKRVLGPAFIPPEILQSSVQKDHKEDDQMFDEETSNEKICEGESQSNQEDNTGGAGKKRRHRLRVRAKGRENVDIDDSNETNDVDKYSGWVPPDDQRGDGMTSLNDKFGY